MSSSIKTGKVAGRRKVDYQTLEEVLADAEKISDGPVQLLGNWSEGQVFRHLARAYQGSIDGIPLNFPLPLRWLTRIFRKLILKGPMPPGFQLPRESAKVLVPDPTTTEDGLAELRAAVARLARDSERAQHPMLGVLSKEEWNRVHLAHAKLHMSFLVPQH